MAKSKPTDRGGAGMPTCNCLLLCDDVIVSHGQDKHTLHGLIGTIAVPALPAVIGGFVAYIRLSNVHRKRTVKVSFEHAATGGVLWEFAAVLVNRNDPLAVYTLVTRVPPFRVEEAGRYILKANHDGDPIAQTPIEIAAPGRGMKGSGHEQA